MVLTYGTQAIQEAVPAKLEKALPNAIHDTRGSSIDK